MFGPPPAVPCGRDEAMGAASAALIGASAVKDDSELLASVESALAESRNLAEFPAWLEARFEREVGPRAGQELARDTIKTAVIYNLLILGDLLLAPDVIAFACVLHLAVITPIMLLIVAALRRAPPRWFRDQPLVPTVVEITSPTAHPGESTFYMEPAVVDNIPDDKRGVEISRILSARARRKLTMTRIDPIYNSEQDVVAYTAYAK